MIGRTHLAVGIASGIMLSQALPSLNMPLMVTASAVGSLLPDICHTNSKMGRKLPFLSSVISFMFGHRTLTHSLVFVFVTSFLIEIITHSVSISLGMCVGMLTHLILDFLTKSGIALFWPLSIKVKNVITVKTGGWVDKIIFYCAMAYIVYQLKVVIAQYFI